MSSLSLEFDDDDAVEGVPSTSQQHLQVPELTQPLHANHVKLRPARKFRRTPSGLTDCRRVLTRVFGKEDYKGKQKEIVEAAVLGADVFVVAPTGMGKSLCFQIPAVADKHGLTIVVSPLLALMKNQVARLRELGVPAVAYTSQSTPEERTAILRDLRSGHPKNRLLYITPEKLCSAEFNASLEILHKQNELSRLVVDEAHCISEWGHDFRADYRNIGSFRDRFPDVPIMALTASATPPVQKDIIASLKMSEEHLFKVVHPFNRPNLFYEVRYLPSIEPSEQHETVHKFIHGLTARRGTPSCGIIYARTKKACDELSEYLSQKGHDARPYHRDLLPKRLDQTLRDWSEGDGCDVVVATVCFGMGIDKADVRFVIHFDLPKSFEGYYQETGRGGRDGLPSKCVIYYSREDVVRVRKLVGNAHAARANKNRGNGAPTPSQRAPHSLDKLVEFCESVHECRHVAICRYFGETIDTDDPETAELYCQKMCDVCKNPEKTKQAKRALASESWVATQVPRLESEACIDDDEEDVDGYPVPRLPTKRVMSDVAETDLDDEPLFNPPPRNLPPPPKGPSAVPKASGFRPSSSTTASLAAARPAFSNNKVEKKGQWWGTDGPGETGGMITKLGGPSSRPRKPRSDDEPDIVEVPKAGNSASSSLHVMPERKGNVRPKFKPPLLKKTSSAAAIPTIDISDDDEKPQTKPKHSRSDEKKRNPPFYDDALGPSRKKSRDTPPPPDFAADVNSSPVKFDEDAGAVEAPGWSKKIPVSLREDEFNTLRTRLHKTFMVGLRGEDLWGSLDGLSVSAPDRNEIVLEAAKQVEFYAMSFSVTKEGYKSRIDARLEAIKAMASGSIDPSNWTETSARKKRAGKEEAVSAEGVQYRVEAEEIVKVLAKLVQKKSKPRQTTSFREKESSQDWDMDTIDQTEQDPSSDVDMVDAQKDAGTTDATDEYDWNQPLNIDDPDWD